MPAIDFSKVQNASTRHSKQVTQARVNVEALCAAQLYHETGGASWEERTTWPLKEAAARAVLVGQGTRAEIAMLAQEAEGRSISVEALADKIVTKADNLRSQIGRVAARRARALAALKAPQCDVRHIMAQLRDGS